MFGFLAKDFRETGNPHRPQRGRASVPLVHSGGAMLDAGNETLLKNIDERMDRRQLCEMEADTKGLGVLEHLSFMQECITR
jgi:hypothetical protein